MWMLGVLPHSSSNSTGTIDICEINPAILGESEVQMGSLRVFIASPNERLRLALIMFLDNQANMVVVGMSDRLTGLIPQLKGSEADVLLLDWEASVQVMADLLTNIDSLEHRPKTVVLSSNKEVKKTGLLIGADYFISKDSPPDKLLPILCDIRVAK